MMTLDHAVLKCPVCGEKEKIILTDRFQPKEHTCPSCKKTYVKKDQSCCIVCEFADMNCLPKQQTGTCSW